MLIYLCLFYCILLSNVQAATVKIRCPPPNETREASCYPPQMTYVLKDNETKESLLAFGREQLKKLKDRINKKNAKQKGPGATDDVHVGGGLNVSAADSVSVSDSSGPAGEVRHVTDVVSAADCVSDTSGTPES